MDNAEGLTTAHYVYRTEVSSSRQRRQVTLYLVALLEGSNVVARIDSLGLASRLKSGTSIVRAERDKLKFIGPWRQTASRHHSKVLVSPLND
jgi:hypothetical protein